MFREITIKLEESLYKDLTKKTNEDIEELKRFIVKSIKEKLKESNQKSLDTDGLGDYLDKSKQGSRNYGVKGQGW